MVSGPALADVGVLPPEVSGTVEVASSTADSVGDAPRTVVEPVDTQLAPATVPTVLSTVPTAVEDAVAGRTDSRKAAPLVDVVTTTLQARSAAPTASRTAPGTSRARSPRPAVADRAIVRKVRPHDVAADARIPAQGRAATKSAEGARSAVLTALAPPAKGPDPQPADPAPSPSPSSPAAFFPASGVVPTLPASAAVVAALLALLSLVVPRAGGPRLHPAVAFLRSADVSFRLVRPG